MGLPAAPLAPRDPLPSCSHLFEHGFIRVVCSRAGSVTSRFSHGLLWIALAVHRVHVHHGKVRRLPSPQAGVLLGWVLRVGPSPVRARDSDVFRA